MNAARSRIFGVDAPCPPPTLSPPSPSDTFHCPHALVPPFPAAPPFVLQAHPPCRGGGGNRRTRGLWGIEGLEAEEWWWWWVGSRSLRHTRFAHTRAHTPPRGRFTRKSIAHPLAVCQVFGKLFHPPIVSRYPLRADHRRTLPHPPRQPPFSPSALPPRKPLPRTALQTPLPVPADLPVHPLFTPCSPPVLAVRSRHGRHPPQSPPTAPPQKHPSTRHPQNPEFTRRKPTPSFTP